VIELLSEWVPAIVKTGEAGGAQYTLQGLGFFEVFNETSFSCTVVGCSFGIAGWTSTLVAGSATSAYTASVGAGYNPNYGLFNANFAAPVTEIYSTRGVWMYLPAPTPSCPADLNDDELRLSTHHLPIIEVAHQGGQCAVLLQHIHEQGLHQITASAVPRDRGLHLGGKFIQHARLLQGGGYVRLRLGAWCAGQRKGKKDEQDVSHAPKLGCGSESRLVVHATLLRASVHARALPADQSLLAHDPKCPIRFLRTARERAWQHDQPLFATPLGSGEMDLEVGPRESGA
jgi:hypothetical protein